MLVLVGALFRGVLFSDPAEGVAHSSAVKAAHYGKEYNIINIYELVEF